ncbi:glutaminyl-peptide cyclotransferase-like [Ixodes scapularis]
MKFWNAAWVLLVVLAAQCAAFNWHKNSILRHLFPDVEAQEWRRDLQSLPLEKLVHLSTAFTETRDQFNTTLKEILIPRTVGSPGNLKVRKYIANTLKNLGWNVELDSFGDNTPLGARNFSNVIATHNPDACYRLVLACHYDSKIHEGGEFLGAVDSAVPCAQLVHIARVLQTNLTEQRLRKDGVTVQLIFFDGEEALVEWTSTDSLYGSRHLAEKWAKERVSQESLDGCVAQHPVTHQLDRMESMALLDLLGASGPTFYSYFENTKPLFLRLFDIEKRLNDASLLEVSGSQQKTSYFTNSPALGNIQDDHIPFLQKNVPILHLITFPFPPEWHTVKDNGDILDHAVITNLNKIFAAFIAEYLKL